MTEREVLEFDILIVGGGPAGLSAALRLTQLQKQDGQPLSVAVLEKAREPGAHSLSGAVLDTSALADLIPDFLERGAPLDCQVTRDDVYLLTRGGRFRFPIVPPPLSNHGSFIVSLSALVKWLAGEVEAAGVDVFSGFAASEVLYDDDRVVGVRTGERGLDRSGGRKANYEAGVDLRAAVTIFCDGVRGNLTKTLTQRHALDAGRNPQTYALGIKELWEVPPGRLAAGQVIHTLGYPLKSKEFGGAFIYGMPRNIVSVGMVSGLDYEDPLFDPHRAFQKLKQHPFVSSLLTGGTLVRHGAKALPEGGWHSVPKLHVHGALIAGDAGGFVNSVRLKGIHLAMRTGMLAAESAFDAVRAGNVSAATLSSYDAAVADGPVKRELYPVRNVHQAFEHGLAAGMVFAGLSLFTGGWWFQDRLKARPGHERMLTLADRYGSPRSSGSGGAGSGTGAGAGSGPRLSAGQSAGTYDRRLTFDRVTGVHYSGTRHREDAPSHLIVHDTDICRTRCREEYGNPCLRFCPAQVYEMVDDGKGGERLQINASNCVHCKTCDIMDPYQIIDWVPPEGGDGPQYEGM